MSKLTHIQDSFAIGAFGRSRTDAINECRCVICGTLIHKTDMPTNTQGNIYSDAGMREYGISGMCEYCFDKATNEFEED